MAARRSSLCVLFADICNSTGLYETLGDEGGRELVLGCFESMARVVERCGGTNIERVGDELLSTFPDAASAGRAACQLHRVVEATNESRPIRMAIRIGFHHGPLLVDDGHIFGDTIHVARRVASLAKPQQILTTGPSRKLIPPAEQLVTRFVDRSHLKGKSESFELFEILWDEGAATVRAETAPSVQAEEKRAIPPVHELELDCGDRTCILGVTRPVVTLGRDARADLIFEHARVSRLHARIEQRRSRFVFVDLSTNGSQVIEVDGRRRFVRRDECILGKEGRIILGPDEADADYPSLGFKVRIGESG
jgi:class 3 adenylate cyclase